MTQEAKVFQTVCLLHEQNAIFPLLYM